MPNVIVCTNFSQTSRNALQYTCTFISHLPNQQDVSILLLHIYSIPVNYNGDGIALASVDTAIKYAEEDLHDELEWAHGDFPDIQIVGKVTAGNMLEALKEQVEDFAASLVVLGAGGNYGDLWSWDTSILDVLYDLPFPVLAIPANVAFTLLQNVAFTCNLKHFNNAPALQKVIRVVSAAQAKLHVVFVISHEIKPGSTEEKNRNMVQEQLRVVEPEYYTFHETEVVGAIGHFALENNIQMLIVMPRKQGLWESLFHKSYTKELAKLNQLPIMAVH